MAEEKQPEAPDASSFRRKYYTNTPCIYEWQLRGMSRSSEDGDGYNYVNPFESLVYGFYGARGSGKDESLTLLAIIAMANGIPAFLNYPVKFYYKKNGADKAELLEGGLLDMDRWLKQDDIYAQSFIGISEFQDWDNAYRQMTLQSLVIHSWIDQIRKMECSFGYTAKRPEDVGGKTISETDLAIFCTDISRATEREGGPKQRGAWIKWNPIIDRSGFLTFKMGTFLQPKEHPMYCLWGSYNTLQKFSFFEAMRGVKLNYAKRVFGDEAVEELDYETIKRKAFEIFQSETKIYSPDFFRTLGIEDNNLKGKIRTYLQDEIGMTVVNHSGRQVFKLNMM